MISIYNGGSKSESHAHKKYDLELVSDTLVNKGIINTGLILIYYKVDGFKLQLE